MVLSRSLRAAALTMRLKPDAQCDGSFRRTCEIRFCSNDCRSDGVQSHVVLQWDRERGWKDHAARDGGKAMFLGTRENSSPGSHDSLEHGSEELYRSFSIEDNLASTSRTVGRLLF